MESATGFAVFRLVNDEENPHLLQVKLVSPSIKDILGIPEPMLFETWFVNMHPDDVDRIDEANRNAFTTLRFDEVYRTYHQGKGEWRWIHAISTGGIDDNGWNKYVNGILFDVTDHKQAEEELKEKTIALKRMKKKIVNIEHKERKIFASDLHDTVGQTLAISIAKLKDIQASSAAGSLEDVAEVQGYLEHSIKEVRGLIHRLSPPFLNEFGIDVVLETLIENHIEKYDTKITYINHLDGQVQFDETTKIILYRIVDELIVNIMKHSKSKSSEIEISKKNDLLLIRVEDNGAGFDTDELKKKNSNGFGIQSISERLCDLNGRL